MKYEKYKDIYKQYLISEKNLSINSVNNFHTVDLYLVILKKYQAC